MGLRQLFQPGRDEPGGGLLAEGLPGRRRDGGGGARPRPPRDLRRRARHRRLPALAAPAGGRRGQAQRPGHPGALRGPHPGAGRGAHAPHHQLRRSRLPRRAGVPPRGRRRERPLPGAARRGHRLDLLPGGLPAPRGEALRGAHARKHGPVLSRGPGHHGPLRGRRRVRQLAAPPRRHLRGGGPLPHARARAALGPRTAPLRLPLPSLRPGLRLPLGRRGRLPGPVRLGVGRRRRAPPAAAPAGGGLREQRPFPGALPAHRGLPAHRREPDLPPAPLPRRELADVRLLRLLRRGLPLVRLRSGDVRGAPAAEGVHDPPARPGPPGALHASRGPAGGARRRPRPGLRSPASAPCSTARADPAARCAGDDLRPVRILAQVSLDRLWDRCAPTRTGTRPPPGSRPAARPCAAHLPRGSPA